MTQDELNARFVWAKDSRWWDSWRRLSGSGPNLSAAEIARDEQYIATKTGVAL